MAVFSRDVRLLMTHRGHGDHCSECPLSWRHSELVTQSRYNVNFETGEEDAIWIRELSPEGQHTG